MRRILPHAPGGFPGEPRERPRSGTPMPTGHARLQPPIWLDDGPDRISQAQHPGRFDGVPEGQDEGIPRRLLGWSQDILEHPADGTLDRVLGLIPHHHGIDVLAVSCGGFQMNLVQQGSTPHGNLVAKEAILEQRHHRPTQKQILLDLVLGSPGNDGLVGEDIPPGDGRHTFSSAELLSA